MAHTVKQVADLAGVTVRTLHHYDRIGLLQPASTTEAGYRLYGGEELERLQQILFFRELGFDLKQIREILDSPEFDRKRAMIAHRELLWEKRHRLDRLIATVDDTIERMERNLSMNHNAMFQGFDEGRIEEQIAKYRDEAIKKYGRESVEQSEQRVRSMSPEDWARVEAESNDINQSLANLMDRHDPESAEVQVQVRRWFELLNRYFSDYSPEMFRGLADLYVDDVRFAANYDRVRPGLAQFLRDGMHAFADRHDEAG